MSSDVKKGGYVEISKRHTETGEQLRWQAQNGVSLQSGKSVKMHGADGGIKFAENDPIELKAHQNLLVKKVEGPEEVVNKSTYEFKATQFSRKVTDAELLQVKWAYSFDDGKTIEPFPTGTTRVEKGIAYKRVYVDATEEETHVHIYAYFVKADQEVSLNAKVIQREMILVVGTEQHSATIGNKMMFPAQAVREIRESFKKNKFLTVLMFTDGFNADEMKAVKRDAVKHNSNVQFLEITSTAELIQYLNKGNGKIPRSKARVSTIKIFSHGLPSKFDFGLDGANEAKQRFGVSDVSKLSIGSFTPEPIIYSYACRTGNSDERAAASMPGYTYGADWLTVVKPGQSLAQKLADHLDATVYAFLRRSNYLSTWNEKGDAAFKKKYEHIEDESVNGQVYDPRDWGDWDEVLWNPDGAYAAPTGGNSPGGIPATLYKFEKGKTPAAN